MNEKTMLCEPEKKFAYALDPIHIGAGGYQLGRVDNSIVREPTTMVPKIPGTSIAGVMRAFANVVKNEGNGYDINRIFGTEEKAGILRFYDGQIIFFPVNSIYGTVWITTDNLADYWSKGVTKGGDVKVSAVNDGIYIVQGLDTLKDNQPINLGWLMVTAKKANNGNAIKIPSKLAGKNIGIVSEKLFSHIVNDNLEVRTSVKIDPDTGAAKDGALFTYEAIPRGTIIGFEIGQDIRKELNELKIQELLERIYPYLKALGIGGMGTRGFGRLEVLTEGRV